MENNDRNTVNPSKEMQERMDKFIALLNEIAEEELGNDEK